MDEKNVQTENRISSSRIIPVESDSDSGQIDSEELKKLGRQTED